MVARRHHHVTGAQNRHQLIHVVLIGAEYRHATQPISNPAAGFRIEALGGGEDSKYVVFFSEHVHSVSDRIQVTLIRSFDLGAGVVKVERTVVAVFAGTRGCMGKVTAKRSFDRPPERVDWADDKHSTTAIPAFFAQRLMTVFRTVRLESPCGISTELRRHSEFAQHRPRFLIPSDNQ